MSRISVIIASRDEGSRLASTVNCLLGGMGAEDELIVVDDGSSDGSADALADRGGRVSVVVNSLPVGVARARNLGAMHSNGEVLIFSDAHVTVRPGWVPSMVDALAADGVGAVGPVIASARDPRAQGWGLRVCDDATNLEWLPPSGPAPYPVPVLAGGFIGVRRHVFEEMGGFDSGMGVYGMDDQEFSMHVWVRGYRCLLVPAVTVVHYYRDVADTPEYQLDWEKCLANVLRMGVVHFGRDRLARLFSHYRSDPCFPASLAAAIAGNAGTRRQWVQNTRVHDDDWYFDRCNAGAPGAS